MIQTLTRESSSRAAGRSLVTASPNCLSNTAACFLPASLMERISHRKSSIGASGARAKGSPVQALPRSLSSVHCVPEKFEAS